jgi:tetratricopeptide (TPR) repeat protein
VIGLVTGDFLQGLGWSFVVGTLVGLIGQMMGALADRIRNRDTAESTKFIQVHAQIPLSSPPRAQIQPAQELKAYTDLGVEDGEEVDSSSMTPSHRTLLSIPETIQHLTKAIESDPQLASAYRQRGIAYFFDGQNERAIQDYDKAISLGYSPLASLYQNRGTSYQELGKQELAERDFAKAKELGY